MALEEKLDKLRKYEQFRASGKTNGKGFSLGNHQLFPVFEAMENGLRRFLLAYSTSAGKTAVALELLKRVWEVVLTLM